VLKHLGGWTGNYTPTVRFHKKARGNLDQLATLGPEKMNAHDARYLKTGDDTTSVLNKVHEWRAQGNLNINRFIENLEQEFLENFGGRKPKTGPLGSGRLVNTRQTETLQKAMNLYIDSGAGDNRAAVERYLRDLKAKKRRSIRETEQIKIMERMMLMSAEEKAWADTTLRPYYEDFFGFAKDHGIIDSHVDNYVKRTWDLPKEYQDANVSWSGSGTTGFKLSPSSGKQRVFNSIVDGWKLGMDLKTEGALTNLQTYANEIGYTFANRRFVDYMRGMITYDGEGLMMELNPKVDDVPNNPPAGMGRVLAKGFAKPGHVLYARADIAEHLNKIGRQANWSLWDKPGVKTIRKLNGLIKSTLLSVSLFHHLAGLRSFFFGTKGAKLNGIKGYKNGLKLIKEQTGFEPENLKGLGPAVDYLVRHGLTVGKIQDWDEQMSQRSAFESLFRDYRANLFTKTVTSLGDRMARARRSFSAGLFHRLFAGLKAQAAVSDFVSEIKKREKKLGRALTSKELDLTAQQVATLINADFGGLNLERMGRDPDMQRVAQLILLAPDWTESNWRTVTGMVPGVNKWINNQLGDNPETPGMGKMYRRFWGGVAVKGMLTLALAQAAILAIFADDKERDEYMENFRGQFTNMETFAKGRWMSLDVTPITRKLGIGDRKKRQSLNVMGHFRDITKVADPVNLIKHKVSPSVRLGESFFTMTDWKGARFTTAKELIEAIEDGKLPPLAVDNSFDRSVSGVAGRLSQLPSWAMYNFRGAMPIFLSEIGQAATGESSAMGAAGRALGVDIRDVTAKSPGQILFEKYRGEINSLDRSLKEAQETGNRRVVYDARADIRQYENYNRIKSRIGYTKAQLRSINRSIRILETKLEKLGMLKPAEEAKLQRLKQKRMAIYRKFEKVMKR
jgi:hypothetical protein